MGAGVGHKPAISLHGLAINFSLLKKKKKSTNNKCWRVYIEKREPSYAVGGNVNWYKYNGKQHGGPSKKQRITTACSSKSMPGHISKEEQNLDDPTVAQR